METNASVSVFVKDRSKESHTSYYKPAEKRSKSQAKSWDGGFTSKSKQTCDHQEKSDEIHDKTNELSVSKHKET